MADGGHGRDRRKEHKKSIPSTVAQDGRPESVTQDELNASTIAQDGCRGSDRSTTDVRHRPAAQDDGIVRFNKEDLLKAIRDKSMSADFEGMQQYGFRYDNSDTRNSLCIDSFTHNRLKKDNIINWNPNTCALIASEAKGEGNCLVNACCLFMWGVNDHGYVLRMKLYRALHGRDELGHKLRKYLEYSIKSMAAMSDKQYKKEWKEAYYIGPMSDPIGLGRDLGDFHIFALSNVLRRPIIVYGEKMAGYTLEGVYLPFFVKPELCIKSPLLIGHGRSHFVPLLRNDTYIIDKDGTRHWGTKTIIEGNFSTYVPINTYDNLKFKVYMLPQGRRYEDFLRKYLKTHQEEEDKNKWYVILDDTELPDKWRAARPELICEVPTSIIGATYTAHGVPPTTDIAIEPDKSSETQRKVVKKRSSTSLSEELITRNRESLIKVLNTYVTHSGLESMASYGYRFDTTIETNVLGVDKTILIQLTNQKVINWMKATCWLLPLKCQGIKNCMTNAISLYLWGIHDHKDLLRKQLQATLSRKSPLYLSLLKFYKHFELQPPVSDEELDRQWEDVSKVWSDVDMDISLKVLNSFHLFTLSNVLRRPIIVYADQTDDSTRGVRAGVYLPLTRDPMACCKSPVLLGGAGQQLLSLMRADMIIRIDETSSHDATWVTRSCGENGQVRDDDYSIMVPLNTHDGKLLPVPYVARGENSRAKLVDYLHSVEFGEYLCAELRDTKLPDKWSETCPESSNNFNDDLPQEKHLNAKQ